MMDAAKRRELASFVGIVTPETFVQATNSAPSGVPDRVYDKACSAAVALTPMPNLSLVPAVHADFLLRVWFTKAVNKRDEFGRRAARMYSRWQH